VGGWGFCWSLAATKVVGISLGVCMHGLVFRLHFPRTGLLDGSNDGEPSTDCMTDGLYVSMEAGSANKHALLHVGNTSEKKWAEGGLIDQWRTMGMLL